MYPTPQQGASLLLSFSLQNRTVLVVGSGTLAAQRAFAALEAGAQSVFVLAQGGLDNACEELKWRVSQNQIKWANWDGTLPSLSTFLTTTQRIWMAFITTPSQPFESLQSLYDLLTPHHILVNITDHPTLCDFSFTSTHRFSYEADIKSPLQVAVTTNGHGCRLAARLRREIVARLPRDVGESVRRVGLIRRMILDGSSAFGSVNANVDVTLKLSDHDRSVDSDEIDPNINEPPKDYESTKTRQLRWLAQISEYWPFEKLASLEEKEMKGLLDDASQPTPTASMQSPAETTFAPAKSVNIPAPPTLPSQHFTTLSPPPSPPPKRGEIFLVGSGPGHPALLTLAAYQLLTGSSLPSTTHTTPPKIDLILSDKLIPPPILSLIPPSIPLIIAQKFPGNADASQSHLTQLALTALREGKRVVRLKQGDPGVFGRLSEEVGVFRREEGVRVVVVPGLSSALGGPLMGCWGGGVEKEDGVEDKVKRTGGVNGISPIALTSRGISDSFIICTGVGKGGKLLSLPPYIRSRSLVVLMGVARLKELVSSLLSPTTDLNSNSTTPALSNGSASTTQVYPPHLPICIIERASLPDQRIIKSTLQDIAHALEWTGEQRPPGLMVIGWCCLGVDWEWNISRAYDDLLAEGAESQDEERVKKWLGVDERGDSRRWVVSEGLDPWWDEVLRRMPGGVGV